MNKENNIEKEMSISTSTRGPVSSSSLTTDITGTEDSVTIEEKTRQQQKQSFPLFCTLEKKWEQLSLDRQSYVTDLEKQYIVEEIKKMDETTQELVYAIIRFYSLFYDKHVIEVLPYSLKKSKQIKHHTYRLDLQDLPIKLQRLLYEFVLLHNIQFAQGKS